MPSLAANFINYIYLPLLGSKRKMKNADKFSRSYKKSPKPCPPPRKLFNTFNISEHLMESGLEYYSVKDKKTECEYLIFYLHGGTYVNNIVKFHWKIIKDLKQKINSDFIIPLYGLAPHYTQEIVFKQLLELYMKVLTENPNKKILIAGDSAGGGLALAFTQMLRDEKQKLPKGLILFSPWLDVSLSDPEVLKLKDKDKMLAIPGAKWAGEKWAGKVAVNNPRVSPLFGSFDNLPPIALFVGSGELLYNDAKRLQKKAIQENLNISFFEYPELFHVWVALPIPEANQAMEQVSFFVKAL
ncbi:alpha/beta hydrolase fold domain-containing protein [Acinetobacter courvalinii]|uniref:alpha/beta hydrolase fold domain-containing protein n=1 Tax=Acinetobacter courvalinii TaxID=280147 RepID=UPI003F561EF5